MLLGLDGDLIREEIDHGVLYVSHLRCSASKLTTEDEITRVHSFARNCLLYMVLALLACLSSSTRSVYSNS